LAVEDVTRSAPDIVLLDIEMPVMDDFGDHTKRAILGRLASLLGPDGHLVPGAAETTTGLGDEFMAVPGARSRLVLLRASGRRGG